MRLLGAGIDGRHNRFARLSRHHAARGLGLLFGGGLGLRYSVTTISGPPLAVMLSNQGFTKQDFRAFLGLVRLAESSFTAVAYYFAGMFSTESAGLLPTSSRVSWSG